MSVVKLKRSETGSSVPTTSDLEVGEVALNTVDQKIYVRDSSNNIVEVANNSTSGGSSYSPDAHLNTSSATANQILTWNGTDYTWTTLKDNQKVFTASSSISAGDVVSLNSNGTVSNYSISNTNWIGIAAENISSGSSGLIDLPGAINSQQSGLTPNNIYYIDDYTTLTTLETSNGKIGIAISSTELQIFEWNYNITFNEQKSNAYGILHIFR